MADNTTKQKTAADEEQQSNDSPVADLNVSTIIVALHQNAVAKCQGDLADKYRIVNSAIDESTGTAALTSSGEQIVSVIPTEAAANAKAFDELGTMPKEDAVKILKTYVQWFVGPDLAKKVSNKTVIALTDAPKDMKDVQARKDAKAIEDEKKQQSSKSTEDKQKEKEDGEHREAQQNAEKDLVDTESVMPVIKFSQFLREADEKTEASSEKPEKEAKPKDAKAKLQQVDQMEVDASTKPQAGYYIVYEMKVEGLKEVKLEDSKKSMRKSIMNYLGNFFDDVKITASGLFGGGDSFTVKDVKDKLRQTFGPIDPDELVRNVQERIDKKFKGSSPHADVRVQDKRTLVLDLGKAITGKEKQKIEKADYSLVIRIDQDDPKKTILNRGLVADIVQASIKGLWKKFKNRINVDDVIYIENYKDIHNNTERIRKLYHLVPSPNKIREQINKAKNANVAVVNIKQALRKVSGDKDRDDCPRAEQCWNAWMKFAKAQDIEKRANDLEKISIKSPQFMRLFQPFIDAYIKAYKTTEDDSLNESKLFVLTCGSLKKDLMQLMFESCLYEDEDGASNAKQTDISQIDVSKLVNRCVSLLNKHRQKVFASDYEISNHHVICASKNDIEEKLKDFDIQSLNIDFGKFKNGIVVCKDSRLLSESMLGVDHFKNDIMDILFEVDEPENTNSLDKNEIKAIDVKQMYIALKTVLQQFGIVDIAEKMFIYELMSLDNLSEADTSKNPIDKDQLEKIRKSLVSDIVNVLTNGGNGAHINPLGGIGTKDEVQSFLKSHGFGTDADYEKLDKPYAMIAYIKRPSDGPVPHIKNKKTPASKRVGTTGQKYATNASINNVFQEIAKKFKSKIGTLLHFNGKPSKPELDSQIFGNTTRKLFYDDSTVLANASVYCVAFDINESGLNPPPDSPPSPPSPPNVDPKDDSEKAYVLPFGKDSEIKLPDPQKIDDPDIPNVEQSRNDLYIIPMPGLQYEDPEYANKKLM